ncbi:phytanoyl-CoA dioxygenase family protein [Sphingosinicella sp.]|uniref:phytanoyl-CoA dioxygenase family protein n=1 Tax=Sphingosinicella sp. TaxID=1917971 RepID=UPI001802EEC6|nr:phytanoyl-CoA dioxygenase family protein [Sphingosinicella sp.]MBA4760116.1 phytanoyl-CoA dioxygenase family protein [Sphingosinicella sp.]
MIEVTDQFRVVGAQLFRGAVQPCLSQLSTVLAGSPADEVGVRLHGNEALETLLAIEGGIGAIAAMALGPLARPVRAILFNKTPTTNWSLAWHQDRTICVRERCEVEGFGPWTVKQGLNHVAPPFDLLTRMVTIRAHLDDVPATNAPLLIAPGSHAVGMVPVSKVEEIVARCGTMACLAAAGDLWLYSTPILHASEAATEPARRRVLQVDYAAFDLPGGLEWKGV